MKKVILCGVCLAPLTQDTDRCPVCGERSARLITYEIEPLEPAFAADQGNPWRPRD